MKNNNNKTVNQLKREYEKSKANETDKNLFGVRKEPDYSEPDFNPMNLEDEQSIDFSNDKQKTLNQINDNLKDEAEPFTPKKSQSRRRGFRR